jgi:hypothetical protein
MTHKSKPDLSNKAEWILKALGLPYRKFGRPRKCHFRANKDTPKAILGLVSMGLNRAFQLYRKQMESFAAEPFPEQFAELHPSERRLIERICDAWTATMLQLLCEPLTSEGLVPWDTGIKLITGIRTPGRAKDRFKSFFPFHAPRNCIASLQYDTKASLARRSIGWNEVERLYRNGFPILDLVNWLILIYSAHQNKLTRRYQANFARRTKRRLS